MSNNTETENTTVQVADSATTVALSKRNFFMFPLGTLGRDFLYNFFNGYLLTFILFTKNLTVAQFSSITFIIIAARIFDAFNDPIMGGIVENTRTKWGKYKPWQLIGGVLTSGVIIAIFNVPLTGWGFIGFLAVGYLLFSITFTMNDISYWGMMPTLTTEPHDRDKLMSFTQIICSIGGGLAGIAVPALTTGELGTAIFGNAGNAYRILSIIVGVMMVGFQMFTIFGVEEKPLDLNLAKQPPMKLKEMFQVLFKNDQLMWAALTMLLFNIGPNIFIMGLGMMYSYLEFGYDGVLWTVFGAGYAVLSLLFTVLFPSLSKKFGRDKVLYSTGFAIIGGFALMLIFGLTLPNIVLFTVPFLNVKVTLKFLMMLLSYTIVGWGTGFYLISVINITNTVEYNEYKTGERKEGLIFSLRPFTAKMGSAITTGLISLVYIIAGILDTTNAISDAENYAAEGEKMDIINNLIANVPEKNKMILLSCMCLIPMVVIGVTLIIYKKKFKLNEATMQNMMEEIAKRKAGNSEIEPTPDGLEAIGAELIQSEEIEAEEAAAAEARINFYKEEAEEAVAEEVKAANNNSEETQTEEAPAVNKTEETTEEATVFEEVAAEEVTEIEPETAAEEVEAEAAKIENATEGTEEVTSEEGVEEAAEEK